MYWGIMIKLTIIEIFIIIFFMSRIKKFRSFFETSFKNLKYLNTLFMIILFILVWIVPKEYFDYLIGIFTVLEILFISWYLLFIETKITEAFKILIFLVFMTIGLNIAKNTSLGDSIGLKDIVYFYGLLTIYYLIAHIKKILSLIINRKIYKIKDNIFTNDKENRNDKIKVEFDESVIPLDTILNIFFTIHDPTTPNRQGNDIGRQYRSVIFYTDENQKPTIEQTIKQLQDMGINVVTEVAPAPEFFVAEDYHQDYFNKNPTQGYCQFAIPPKLAKLRQNFADYLK